MSDPSDKAPLTGGSAWECPRDQIGCTEGRYRYVMGCPVCDPPRVTGVRFLRNFLVLFRATGYLRESWRDARKGAEVV